MRKILTVLVAIATLGIWSCNNDKAQKDEFTINGKIEGIDSTMIFLKKFADGEMQNLDSVKLNNGAFSFTGKVDAPEAYYIMLNERRAPITIFVENTGINVEAHVDSLHAAIISGSASNDEYATYNKGLKKFEDLQSELYGKYMEAQQSQDASKMQEIQDEYSQVYEQQMEYVKDFVGQNLSSYITPYIVSNTLSYQLEHSELDSIVSLFDSKLEASVYTQSLKERIAILEKVAIGKVAPDFTMNDTAGNPLTLSDLRGEYLLIDFWAAWCRPCRVENPNVVALYEQYKDKGFEILGVSFDRTKEDWVKAIHDDGITWPQVSDLEFWNNAAGKLYGVRSIPHTVLLDPEGVIIDKNLRGDELRNRISELLDK